MNPRDLESLKAFAQQHRALEIYSQGNERGPDADVPESPVPVLLEMIAERDAEIERLREALRKSLHAMAKRHPIAMTIIRRALEPQS